MKNLLNTLLLLLPWTIFAQKITISEEIQLRNDISYDIIGNYKDRTLLFRNRVTQFDVEAFNKEMRQSWTKELKLEKRSPKIIGIAPGDTSFMLFYQYRDKGSQIVKANRYDPAANLRDTATLKDLGFLFYTPNFQMVLSEDKNKAVLYYVENQQTFHALGFDLETMEVLWDKSFKPNDLNYWEDFLQVIVDNNANMYLVLEKNRFRFRRDPHYHEIWQVNETDNTPLRIVLPMGEERTSYDVRFAYDNKNEQLIGAGMYTDKNLDRAEGYYYLQLDPKNPGTFLLSFAEFDDDFVTNLIGKPVEDNKGVMEVAVRDLVLRNDGGILMIAERTREQARVLSGGRAFVDAGVRQIVDHYYDDIFIISIHPTGDTHWRTILYKKQYSQDDNAIYSSFFLFKTMNSLHLLFNDEISYENTVSEYVVFGNGSFDRKSVLSTAKLDLRLRFRDAVQISADALIIPSERRNRLRLVRLQY